MYIRWNNFKCPHCGKTWACRVVSAPRVGRELRTCSSCGMQFTSHDREWAHMTRGQKLGYLVSEWVVGWLLFYALLFSSVLVSDNKMEAVFVLLGVGVVVFAPI